MPQERQREGTQLHLRGFHEPTSRLRRARRAYKRIPESRKSVVLEEEWSGGLDQAHRKLAQHWQNNRRSFNFRVRDEIAHQYNVSTEVGDSAFSPQDEFIAAVNKAKRRELPALTIVRRLVKARAQLAQELNDDIGWTRDFTSQAIALVGESYRLQPSTIRDYQRLANVRAKKLEPRLR